MRSRVTTAILLAATMLLVSASSAMAHDGGEGWMGETNDTMVTNFGFVIIAAFPLLILLLSLLQWRLDVRKDRRKKAAKARVGRAQLRGGW